MNFTLNWRILRKHGFTKCLRFNAAATLDDAATAWFLTDKSYAVYQHMVTASDWLWPDEITNVGLVKLLRTTTFELQPVFQVEKHREGYTVTVAPHRDRGTFDVSLTRHHKYFQNWDEVEGEIRLLTSAYRRVWLDGESMVDVQNELDTTEAEAA